MILRVCVLALAGAVVAGCQTSGGSAPAAVPANYRVMVADEVRKTFFDPYSIRDASISAPIPGTSMMGAMHTVCVRANAKNRMGGYTGIRTTAVVIRSGAVTVSDQSVADIACASATYEPFPEIDSAAAPAPARRR